MHRVHCAHLLRSTLRRLVTLFCITSSLFLATAHAQKAAENPAPAAGASASATPCTAPADLTPAHLHGTWTVSWLAVPAPAPQTSASSPATASSTSVVTSTVAGTLTGTARLELAANPDYPESVIGLLIDGTERHDLAGDLDQGLLTLEESTDGKGISANWVGTPEAGKCGREIRGNWLSATSALQRGFVLRRVAQW